MYAWHQIFALRLAMLDLADMGIAFQTQIGIETVRLHLASQFDGLPDKAVKTGFSQIGDSTEPYAPNALSIFLCGNDNQRFFFCEPADDPFFLAIPIGLVHLDGPPQRFATRTHHRSP